MAIILVAALIGVQAVGAVPSARMEDGAVGYKGQVYLGYKDEWGDWGQADPTGCYGTTHMDFIPVEEDTWRLHFVAAAHCSPYCPRDLMDALVEARWRELQIERRLTGNPQNFLLPQQAMVVCETELSEHSYGIMVTGSPGAGFQTGNTYIPYGEVNLTALRLLYAGWHLFFNKYYVWDAQVEPEFYERPTQQDPSWYEDEPMPVIGTRFIQLRTDGHRVVEAQTLSPRAK
jgi:hypothetical protein